MITFEVRDMSCNHCVGSITKAVNAVDHAAAVRIDLATKRVEIAPSAADAEQLKAAIGEAGFTPVEVS